MERDWPTVWGQGSQFGPDAKVIPCVVICFPVPLKSVDVPLSGRYTDKPLVGTWENSDTVKARQAMGHLTAFIGRSLSSDGLRAAVTWAASWCLNGCIAAERLGLASNFWPSKIG